MKIEEAIEWMEEAVQETTECFEQCSPSLQKELVMQKEAFELAITALRPVSREQVEKVWRGEWVEEPYSTKSERNRTIHSKKCTCSVCNKSNGRKKENFCPHCGSPMTDEAVQAVMERMEALHENIYNG